MKLLLMAAPNIRLRISMVIALFLHLSFVALGATPANDEVKVNTFVFQAAGLNSEGVHPVFLTRASTVQIASALGDLYPESSSAAEKPQIIYVIIPDTMSAYEENDYREELKSKFYLHSRREWQMITVRIPVRQVLGEGEALINSMTEAAPKDPEVHSFLTNLNSKLQSLRVWSQGFTERQSKGKRRSSVWTQLTNQEKDRAILTIFGAVRGVPGVAVYALDAGFVGLNIVRMALAYSADIFFTVAPQKLAALPERLKIPEFAERGTYALSWLGSGGLMAAGYFGLEVEPRALHFQISRGLPVFRNWFNHNNELKSVLFNYGMSLGIPLTFLSLGYLAKGGDSSGMTSPFDISFLLEFAGLQIIDGVMNMFGGRGARVLGAKGYLSGRQENIFYSLLNLLGQAQGLGVATGHNTIYKMCLATKSILQGLTFFISRVVPAKSADVFLFHAEIGARDRDSYLYESGLVTPHEVGSFNELMQEVSAETQGASVVNQWFSRLGGLFRKNNSVMFGGGSDRCQKALSSRSSP